MAELVQGDQPAGTVISMLRTINAADPVFARIAERLEEGDEA
jgi:hypothetical protein